MNAKLTDTQKFRLANDIARHVTGQAPAYGVQHWQQKEELVKPKKLNKHIEIAILILAIVSCPGVLLLIAALLP